MSMKELTPEIREAIRRVEQEAGEKFGIAFESVEAGEAVAFLVVKEEMLNQLGSLYGGALFNLADLTCGAACLSAGGGGPTISGNMDYLSAARLGDRICCRARANKVGRNIGFVSCSISGEKGEVIATASFSFFRVTE